mgnify:CR=1 FL=1
MMPDKPQLQTIHPQYYQLESIFLYLCELFPIHTSFPLLLLTFLHYLKENLDLKFHQIQNLFQKIIARAIEKKEKGEPSPLAEEVKAKELRQQQLEELENEEPSKVVVAEDAPLGPGGLSPQEVFDSLPEKMQECFASQDIPLLQKVVEEMPQEEAAYHMKRCIDSGLWVP